MSNVPVPSETHCEAVYQLLNAELEKGTISMSDEPQKRLKWLIEQFSERDYNTTRALKNELSIVEKWMEDKR